MVDFSPTAYYLPWTIVLNNALIDFFKAFNDSFTKNEKGYYVFSAKFEKVKIKRWFAEKMREHIDSFTGFMRENPHVSHVFLVETCKTNDNVFLESNQKYNLSYKLLEEDIHLDMVKMEDIFDRIFNQYFFGKISLGENFKVVRHKNLPASTIRSLILKKYGKKHFVDLSNTGQSQKIIADLNEDLQKKNPPNNSSVDFFIKEVKEKYLF